MLYDSLNLAPLSSLPSTVDEGSIIYVGSAGGANEGLWLGKDGAWQRPGSFEPSTAVRYARAGAFCAVGNLATRLKPAVAIVSKLPTSQKAPALAFLTAVDGANVIGLYVCATDNTWTQANSFVDVDAPDAPQVSIVSKLPAGQIAPALAYLTAVDGSHPIGLYVCAADNIWTYALPALASGVFVLNSSGLTLDPRVVPYDVAAQSETTPQSSQVLSRVATPRAFRIPKNLVGTVAKVEIAPTAPCTFVLAVNGSQVGTVTIAVDKSVSLSMANDCFVNAGDVVTIVAPAQADVTIAKLSIVVAGYLL